MALEEEIALVRWQLDKLVGRRLLGPLERWEQDHYRLLVTRERDLLAGLAIAAR